MLLRSLGDTGSIGIVGGGSDNRGSVNLGTGLKIVEKNKEIKSKWINNNNKIK